MNIKIPAHYGRAARIIGLERHLTPTNPRDVAGAVEDAAREATLALETIGRLLAALVQRKVLSFDVAEEIAERYVTGELQP